MHDNEHVHALFHTDDDSIIIKSDASPDAWIKADKDSAAEIRQ